MCGDGFGGGGCPEEAITQLQLKNQTVRGCLLPSDDQSKLQLSLTYLETPQATFGLRGTVDNTQAGRSLLNDILASFAVEE